MKKELIQINKGFFISQAYEETAAVHKSTLIAAQVKTIRLFGVVGITDGNIFQRTKNFLLETGCLIVYNEKKGLIWVREVGEVLDKLFSGLSKYS